jgi:predicted dithiol-disulfide oxidoreductase (DUF899 family)
MNVHFPNESAEYRAARDRLLEKEIELRRQMETLAEERRKLPLGGVLKEDYVFDGLGHDGEPARIRFSELFARGRDTLILYNMMFPRFPTDTRPKPDRGAFATLPRQDGPCPSCIALVDQFDGAAPHLEAAGFNFVIVAKTSLERLLTFACERGWRHLRYLSSASNSFKCDYHGEDEEGGQEALLQVFHRSPEGIRHFWSSELQFTEEDPGQDQRAFGTIEPLWNFIDLTPEGRSEWNVSVNDRGPKDAKPAIAGSTGVRTEQRAT